MGKARFILSIITSFIPLGSSLLRAKDANSTGADDFAADVLDYTNQVLSAALNGQPIPFPPESITKGPRPDLAPSTPV